MNDQWQELKETIIELRDNDGTATQQEVCKFLVNLMELLEKQISSSDFPNKWIPVKKELPKKGQHVLVSLDCEYVTEDYFAYSTEWFDSFINSEEKVVAWTPMPESYKAESEV